jgi:hypothetical protein
MNGRLMGFLFSKNSGAARVRNLLRGVSGKMDSGSDIVQRRLLYGPAISFGEVIVYNWFKSAA